MLVFVYGTLKSAQMNHHIIEHTKAQLICNAQTTEIYPMFDIGDGFPYLQDNPGIGLNVQGEIYEVQEEFEEFLDYFEGVPTLYKKGTIDLTSMNKLYKDVNCYFQSKETDLDTYKQTYLTKW